MKSGLRVFSSVIGVWALSGLCLLEVASAQHRGGGRQSLGNVGGGGTGGVHAGKGGGGQVKLPSGGGNRPSMPSNRPSFGNAQAGGMPNPGAARPATRDLPSQRPAPKLPTGGGAGSIARPNVPNLGADRPSLGGIGGPTTRPAPSQRPGGLPSGGPTTRPAPGGVDRPTPVPGTRPGGLPGDLGGAGGNRPSLPMGERPTVRPPQAKPPLSRPSLPIAPGEGTRPAPLPGGVERPQLPDGQPSRPLPGGTRPVPDRPTTRPVPDRPTTRPTPDRPTPLPGEVDRPTTRPNRPDVDKPTLGNARPLPGDVTRPLPGDLTRPGGARPLPGDLTRPVPGDLTRPGGARPLPGDVTRPNVRPETRPVPPVYGKPNRPDFGDTTVINNRPIIGGNQVNVGNNVNININQNTNNNFFNRPNWDFDPGYSRPAWGVGGNYWYDRWHVNCVHNHHNWYNGCWHGYWGSSWYAPVTYVAVGWGLGAWASSWSNQPVAYVNPYVVAQPPAQPPVYDYSQPVVVNNYVTAGADGQPTATEPKPQEQDGLAVFDEGLARFKRGEYPAALVKFDQALRQLPQDAVVHEVRCLTLFAVGDYATAAAGLNSLLSSAPGMDWTSVSSLYGNVDDYTAQLRKLEQFVEANPAEAAGQFVLAYQYLMLGEQDMALAALREVTRLQPQDAVAARMLTALDPPPAPAPSRALVRGSAEAEDADDAAANLETDLVGRWQAKTGPTTIELTIQEDFTFVWTARSSDQPPVELTGNLAGTATGIELITSQQGVLAGAVVSGGPDAWNFKISEAAATDPGLSFQRVK